MYLLRLMLVGVWLGLLWVLFYFFDHYIQSSVQLRLTRGSPGRSLGSFRGGTQPRLPMLIGCSGTRPLDGRRRDGGWVP